MEQDLGGSRDCSEEKLALSRPPSACYLEAHQAHNIENKSGGTQRL